jgi:hypothetical protein
MKLVVSMEVPVSNDWSSFEMMKKEKAFTFNVLPAKEALTDPVVRKESNSTHIYIEETDTYEAIDSDYQPGIKFIYVYFESSARLQRIDIGDHYAGGYIYIYDSETDSVYPLDPADISDDEVTYIYLSDSDGVPYEDKDDTFDSDQIIYTIEEDGSLAPKDTKDDSGGSNTIIIDDDSEGTSPVDPSDSDDGDLTCSLDSPSHVILSDRVKNSAQNELTIFKGEGFTRDQWTLKLDLEEPDRPYYFQLKGTGFNKEVSSWILGKNLHADFCQGDLLDDRSYDEDGAPVFSCPDTGLALGSAVGASAVSKFLPDDTMSGVILRYYDPLSRPAATVYSGCDCQGRSAAVFTSGSTESDPVAYNLNDLRALGIGDNSISSFMAPVGTHVHVYEQHMDMGGEWRDMVFEGQEDQDGWMVC